MMRVAELVAICTLAFNYIVLVNSEVAVKSKIAISQEQQCINNSQFPWIPLDFEYPSGILRLHTEIEQFYQYMQPTSIERALRMRVVYRVQSVVKQIWPDASAKVFGSFASGLASPTSDIDLMLIGASGPSPMRSLASEISASGIAEPNSLNVRDDIRIPLVEFVDRESKLNVDIPIYNEGGLQVAPLFSEFQRKYPVLWKLMFVLKQYLKQRDLNDVFTGGISSFALTLMCISFLQKHTSYKPSHQNADVNLGELLIDFLELYGEKFDYERTGISIKNGGEYMPRNEMPCNGDQQLFCVEDPANHWLNACSVTYRGPEIRQAFREAHSTLTAHISSNGNSANSILGHLVHVSQDFIEYRKWIQDTFGHTSVDGKAVNIKSEL